MIRHPEQEESPLLNLAALELNSFYPVDIPRVVENNLSIANMGFDEFANTAGPDGIFRGAPDL